MPGDVVDVMCGLIWSSVSDINVKENAVELDGGVALDNLKGVNIYEYNYRATTAGLLRSHHQ